MADLVSEAFLALRARFFDASGRSIPFDLRDKAQTQDDPFDEFIARDVLGNLPGGIKCDKAQGGNTSPDMVLHLEAECRKLGRAALADALNAIVAIEVKKIDRVGDGLVARAAGMDYNTTPPCGKINISDAKDIRIAVRCFYLFACVEPEGAKRKVTALALVDGNAINADFALYEQITGERTKRINLGTYADGADRVRPMVIFSNPLGCAELDRRATLVHPSDQVAQDKRLVQVHELQRTTREKTINAFYCYRVPADAKGMKPSKLLDPFPKPVKRDEKTRKRGKFKLGFAT